MKELDDDSTRFYHPNLDGIPISHSILPTLILLKENHANQMVNSFPLMLRLSPHLPSPTTIGLHLNRVLGSNLQRSCIRKHLSQTTSSTNFSASGVQH